MKAIKKVGIALLIIYSFKGHGQQESIITNYMDHLNIFNPAAVGVDNETLFNATFRKQWTGIADAPETSALSFSTSAGKNLGIGISMFYERTFVERQNYLAVDFSYRVGLSENTALYFGLKAGGNMYSLNLSGIEEYNVMTDPALSSADSFMPNIGVGALIKHDKYYVSLSIPRILNTTKALYEQGIATTVTDRPHIYLSAGYNIQLGNEKLLLKPSFMARYVNGAPFSIDINSMLEYNRAFEIGATYRSDDTFAGLIKFRIKKVIKIGYAYEVSTTSKIASARNTNEFIFQMAF